jgi:hypothetical protein
MSLITSLNLSQYEEHHFVKELWKQMQQRLVEKTQQCMFKV